MKFLDQAKVYIRSGNGGGGVFPFAGKSTSLSAAPMAATAVKAATSGPRLHEISTHSSITVTSNILKPAPAFTAWAVIGLAQAAKI